MKRWLWNHALVPLLNLVCRGEKSVMTSRSGAVEILLCEGWCKAFKISAHGFTNVGFGAGRFQEKVLPAYEQRLRAEGFFEDADSLRRVIGALVK